MRAVSQSPLEQKLSWAWLGVAGFTSTAGKIPVDMAVLHVFIIIKSENLLDLLTSLIAWNEPGDPGHALQLCHLIKNNLLNS